MWIFIAWESDYFGKKFDLLLVLIIFIYKVRFWQLTKPLLGFAALLV